VHAQPYDLAFTIASPNQVFSGRPGGSSAPVSVSASEGPLEHVERSALERSLREAEESALAELATIRETLRRSVEAVTRGDTSLAEAVMAEADEVERRYSDVHERLVALIARHAPVAGDLRLAIALLHVNDRVERMGAQCVNIAKLCCAMPAGSRPAGGQLDCLAGMASLADEQVAEAARVFAERDIEGARNLREHDQGINSANRRCFEFAVHDRGAETRREGALMVTLMARALERIGDNAVDVGRQAIFAVSGRLRD
jgi:phosphate transport system protein